MQAPLYETEDYQGARDVLAVIQDLEVIQDFMRVLEDKQVLLADGHHRYESSLAYRKKMKQANPHHTGQEAYNYHFMYLTNTESRMIYKYCLRTGLLPNITLSERRFSEAS